ncbi:MAG: cell envelope integrity protein CreD [Opitutaceae bacterium]|jgi:inner membrane protein|nr:cell envelope integrity protein CreD [Opitutaceae bacterium]
METPTPPPLIQNNANNAATAANAPVQPPAPPAPPALPAPLAQPNWPPSVQHTLALKLATIVAFALLLLLPLFLVRNTLNERQTRYNEAVASITGPWGGRQHIIGPILVVPFTQRTEVENRVAATTATAAIAGNTRIKEKTPRAHQREACFLPAQLNIQGTLAPHRLKRSIHTAHVYSASLRITGKFDKPSFAFPDIEDAQPDWTRARVCFAISDLRGVRESLTLVWAGENVSLQPGDGYSGGVGLHAMLPSEIARDGGEFSFDLTLNGNDSLMVAPLARSTKMHLTSPWPDPSFCGDYLPVSRNITPAGFDALWETSYYARTVPQQWHGDPMTYDTHTLAKGSFGVRMQPAISAYRIVERAIKYGILFIALTFTVFFLFEAVAGLRLNALNYLLVGATLCVFFLGLLALSEFIPFGAAYAISGVTAIVMIGLYCARILRGARRALAVSALLGGVYAYLYFVLRMEDFALIAGTAALFAVLGAVMYATRKIGTPAAKTPRETPAAPDHP